MYDIYRWLCNLRFGRRLALGFSILGVLLIVTGLVGIRQAFVLANVTERMHRHPFAVSTGIRDVRAGIFAIHRDLKDIMLARSASEIDAAAASIDRHDAEVRKALALIEERFLGDKSDVAKLDRDFRAWAAIRNERIAERRRGGDGADAVSNRTRGTEAVAELIAQSDKILAFASEKADHFMAEAGRTRSFVLWLLSGLLLAAVGLGAAVSLMIARSVTAPMATLRETMERLAGGETRLDVPLIENRDEIGDMARTVAVFRSNAIAKEEAEQSARAAAAEAARQDEERRRLEAEQQASEREAARAARARAKALDELVASFESRVTEIMATLSSAASGMTATADNLKAVASGTADRSRAVRDAGEEASRNVATAAGAAEEMSAAIQEISRQVTSANSVAGEAVREVQESVAKVKALSGSASRVSEVVTLINDIAEQTNLLALNATIEAARAGEAGKGFAVVASEVKSLAAQTRKAIEEISELISGIEAAGQDAVSTMSRMDEVIAKISEANANIASAVAQQSGATHEIARNVQQASTGTNRVAEEIHGVSEGAAQTGSAATQMQASAQELEKLASEIETRIRSFIEGVRTA